MASTEPLWPLTRNKTHRYAVALVAISMIVMHSSLFLQSFRVSADVPVDFFQDYASARNLMLGKSMYTHHLLSINEYLGLSLQESDIVIPHNMHPPMTALLVLPLALLDYESAKSWWNFLTLICLAATFLIFAREMNWKPTPLSLLIVLAIVVSWAPIRIHILLGQWGLLMLLLITGAWIAGRRGHLRWCGVLLGFASAIKFLPLVIIGYLVLRRRWTAALAGMVTFALLTLGTVMIVGTDNALAYVGVTMTDLPTYRPHWSSASLSSYFAHLFAPNAGTEPVVFSPLLATLLTAVSSLAVIGALAWQSRTQREDFDGEFGSSVTASILLSVLAWDHYLVMLLLPFAIWVRRFSLVGWPAFRRWYIYMVCWLLLAVPQVYVTVMVTHDNQERPIRLLITLIALGLNTYGIVGIFLCQLWWLRHPLRIPIARLDGVDAFAAAQAPIGLANPFDREAVERDTGP